MATAAARVGVSVVVGFFDAVDGGGGVLFGDMLDEKGSDVPVGQFRG
jgi:hypothetical protein